MEEHLPDDHYDLGILYDNIGAAYSMMKKYTIALTYHNRALVILEQNPSSNVLDVAFTYFNIGHTHQGLKNYQQALDRYHKAQSILVENKMTSQPLYSQIEVNIQHCKHRISRSAWMSQIN